MDEKTQRVGGTKHLNEESWKALPDLLLGLRIAVTNIAFYPPGSNQVTVALESAFSGLARMLESNSVLILAESEGGLLANGQPLKEEQAKKMAGVFLQNLIDCHIKSVTFRQGLDLDELFVFLKGLGEKKWMKEKGIVLSEELEKSNIYHIGIDEKIYVPIGEGDLVIERAKDILTRSGGRIDEVMRAIEEASEMVGAVEDEAARDKVRDEIAKRMLMMDPSSFADLLKREAGGEVQAAKEQAVSSFSDEKIREIVAELSETYVKLRKSAAPGAAEAVEMERIKDVIEKILSLAGKGAVSIEVYRDLVREGVLEEVVRWGDVKSEGDLVGKAEKLARCDPSELVTRDALEEIKTILAELNLRDETGLAERIVNTLGRGLASPTADIRLKVAEAVNFLSPEIASYGSSDIDARLVDILVRNLEKETDSRVYKILGRLLSQMTKKFIRQMDLEKAKKPVGMFRNHKRAAGAGFTERSNLALEELMWIGDEEIARLLLEELKSKDQSRRRLAHDIVMRLEEAIIRHLVNAVKETKGLRHRKYLSSILKELGEEATARLVEELESDMSVSHTIRLMEILDGMEKPEIALAQLRKALSHPHPQVRHEAIGTLKKFGGKAAGEVLVNALGDRNFFVLRYAVQVIGDVKFREASDKLIDSGRRKRDFSAEEKDALLEEICVSLGKLRGEGAVPFLTKVARSRMIAGIFKRRYAKNVRVAAIRALGRFGTEEARGTLEILKKEKDNIIRNAALSALS